MKQSGHAGRAKKRKPSAALKIIKKDFDFHSEIERQSCEAL